MKKVMYFLGLLLFAGLAMAQGDHGAAEAALSGGFWSPGIAMAFAAGICGLAQGKGIQAACEGMARNPGAAGDIRLTMIIGLALIESLAIYTLVVVFVKG